MNVSGVVLLKLLFWFVSVGFVFSVVRNMLVGGLVGFLWCFIVLWCLWCLWVLFGVG
jgi:hypothetical protein